MTEVMPHTMPNIVRKLRSFVSQSAESVCLRISWNGISGTDPGQESSFAEVRKKDDKGSLAERIQADALR